MPLPSGSVSERLLMRDEAHRRLRALIVEGTLRPGERLRDAEVAKWLGVSRTPVREALVRLVDEGLVEMAPNRYTRVADLDRTDATELFPVAAVLHGLAAAAAAARCSPTGLERLRAEAERFTWASWRREQAEALAADEALHTGIVALAGNRQLTRTLDQITPRLRRLEASVWLTVGPDRPGEHHDRLLAALGSADSAAASDAAAGEWHHLGELVARALA